MKYSNIANLMIFEFLRPEMKFDFFFFDSDLLNIRSIFQKKFEEYQSKTQLL